jgi:hypothetical protein
MHEEFVRDTDECETGENGFVTYKDENMKLEP